MGKRMRQPGPLTPEQAQKARRANRLACLAAVMQSLVVVALTALAYPPILPLIAGLTVVYLASVPLLLRRIDRNIDKRIVSGVTENRDAERAFGSTGL
jgi:hypothetical protein